MNGYIISGIFICLILIYILWQYIELKRFSVTEYNISSHKIKGTRKIAVLTDLHGFQYGKENKRLIEKIRDEQPEIILVAGDMIVSNKASSFQKSLETLKRLVRIAPVYYAFGNHESKAQKKGVEIKKEFENYYREVEKAGVHILRNDKVSLQIEQDIINLAGLEIDINYYKKGKSVPMEEGYIQELLGVVEQEKYQLLLAHNPMYSEQYVHWGADLTFCGHNHGGLICFSKGRSFMSPQLTFFPKYNAGQYHIEGKNVIVSRGLGTHTFHIRICNRAEVLVVTLLPNTLEKKPIN